MTARNGIRSLVGLTSPASRRHMESMRTEADLERNRLLREASRRGLRLQLPIWDPTTLFEELSP